MRVAHELAKRCMRDYSCKFSRKDFTLPQLFACLVVREQQNKSYRGVEALLRDSEHWCKQIGMRRVPDHNTLCRAFKVILSLSRIGRLLDRLAQWMMLSKLLGTTCAIDSTLYDTHHRSRHYEQRCRQYSAIDANTANSRRSRSARRTPKLSLSVDTASHIILAARARTGMGCDAPDFVPLLRDSKRRRPRLKTVLADAGYDSHENHRIARTELKVRSLIPAGTGRPTVKPPASCYRRLMRKRLTGSQKGKPYGQRAQSETVNSMMKRNLGDHLRARTAKGRRREQMLRVITHDLMVVLSRLEEGRD
jgi:IS5 family transposase